MDITAKEIIKELKDAFDKRGKGRTEQQRDKDEAFARSKNEMYENRISLINGVSRMAQQLIESMDVSKILADATDELKERLIERDGRIGELKSDLDKRTKDLYLGEEALKEANAEVARLKALLKNVGIDPDVKKPAAPATNDDIDMD